MTWVLAAVVTSVVGLSLLHADQALSPAQAAYLAYQEAKTAFERTGDDPALAWCFGRTCFDWAEFSTNQTHRANLAREGILACEMAVEKVPESAGAHYYLGMNQGQLARTMSLGALKLVTLMEQEFSEARELDPEFAHAGPDRNLGLLYLEAPGWPVSIGNRSKARAHLHNAVKLAPHFPENRLNLMEAYQQWGEQRRLRRELEEWDANLEAARKLFSGQRWQWDWTHWEARVQALRESLAASPPELRSPKARE